MDVIQGKQHSMSSRWHAHAFLLAERNINIQWNSVLFSFSGVFDVMDISIGREFIYCLQYSKLNKIRPNRNWLTRAMAIVYWLWKPVHKNECPPHKMSLSSISSDTFYTVKTKMEVKGLTWSFGSTWFSLTMTLVTCKCSYGKTFILVAKISVTGLACLLTWAYKNLKLEWGKISVTTQPSQPGLNEEALSKLRSQPPPCSRSCWVFQNTNREDSSTAKPTQYLESHIIY